MNNDPDRPSRNDTAAFPVKGETRRSSNPLWYLLLLLIPLLFLPFCHHRDADRTVAATPTPVVSTPGSTNAAAVNPFSINAGGNDEGKAVLNFDVNTTTPNAAAMTTLSAVTAYLQANPAAKVSLQGFTDNTGTAEVNRKLTQQRIDAVKSDLTGAGIDAGRIATANFGEAYPISDNSNPQARELNRRVEITLAK